jgi:Ser-Thr-rich glycosyl-phosphatidyl-inositol-anchored membrane family
MRSTFISAAVLAFASAVFATNPTPGFDPITSPFQDENVPAGKPFEIVWEPSKSYTGTVTIQLLQGATISTLSAGDVIKGE